MMRSILRNILLLMVALSNGLIATAQDVKAYVRINTDQIEGTNKEIYTELSNDLTEFINSRRWTDATFSDEERIECNFVITLEKAAGENYSGQLQVQASRPVFNSGYNTTLFNFLDKNLQFNYTQYQKLEFDENTYENNLLSTIKPNPIVGL